MLETCHREDGDCHVLVCPDGTSGQRTKETRRPRLANPGRPAQEDFGYERDGIADLFLVVAPLLEFR